MFINIKHFELGLTSMYNFPEDYKHNNEGSLNDQHNTSTRVERFFNFKVQQRFSVEARRDGRDKLICVLTFFFEQL